MPSVLSPIKGAALSAIVANTTVTNATTNISGGTYTIPANDVEIGSVFRYTGYLMCVGAASAPSLVIELLINGSVVSTDTIAMVQSVLTRQCRVEALITIRTTGSSGTCKAEVMGISSVAASFGNITGNPDGSTATDAIDTTVSRSLEVRARMSAAVASTTITFTQGFWERVR